MSLCLILCAWGTGSLVQRLYLFGLDWQRCFNLSDPQQFCWMCFSLNARSRCRASLVFTLCLFSNCVAHVFEWCRLLISYEVSAGSLASIL